MPRGEANGKTWIAVDVELFDHPKLLEPAATRRGDLVTSYLALVAYSRRQQTDGYIKAAAASGIVQRAIGDTQVIADRCLSDLRAIGLLTTGRWGYRIPDYGDWQQTKADVIALSERQSKAGQASARKRRKPTARSTSGTPAVQPAVNRAEKRRVNPTEPRGPADAAREAVAKRSAAAFGDNEIKPAELANTAIRTDPIGRLMAAIGNDADQQTETTITTMIERGRLAQADIERAREAVTETKARNRARYAVGTIKAIIAERVHHPEPQI